MPTYVYRCQQCAVVIERRQRFVDAPLTLCDTCGGELRRVVQPVGIIFKGSGFYSTDHKSGSRVSAEEANAEPAKSAAESSSTTTAAETSTSPTPSTPSPAPAAPATPATPSPKES